MKIVIWDTALPYRGGIATYNERLACQFVADGHEVEICTFILQHPGFMFSEKTQYYNSAPPQSLVIKRKPNTANTFNRIEVTRQLRKLNPDTIDSFYNGSKKEKN